MNIKDFICIHHTWSTDNSIIADTKGIDLYHGSYRYNGRIYTKSEAEALMIRGLKVEKPWSKGKRGSSNGYSIINERANLILTSFYRRTVYERNVAAEGFNNRAVHIANVGCFDDIEPASDIWELTLRQCDLIINLFDIPIKNVVGHWETFVLLGKAKNRMEAQKIKSCPGYKWDMDFFRKQLKERSF